MELFLFVTISSDCRRTGSRATFLFCVFAKAPNMPSDTLAAVAPRGSSQRKLSSQRRSAAPKSVASGSSPTPPQRAFPSHRTRTLGTETWTLFAQRKSRASQERLAGCRMRRSASTLLRCQSTSFMSESSGLDSGSQAPSPS